MKTLAGLLVLFSAFATANDDDSSYPYTLNPGQMADHLDEMDLSDGVSTHEAGILAVATTPTMVGFQARRYRSRGKATGGILKPWSTRSESQRAILGFTRRRKSSPESAGSGPSDRKRR